MCTATTLGSDVGDASIPQSRPSTGIEIAFKATSTIGGPLGNEKMNPGAARFWSEGGPPRYSVATGSVPVSAGQRGLLPS